MKRPVLLSLFAVAAVAFISGCTSAGDDQLTLGEKNLKEGYYVSAYIWPSCHDDPVARKYLWTEGIGEWEVIQKGNARFPGHYQPKQPLWGYEMDDDPVVVEKWIQTALKYGVNTFCYDWYWYKRGDEYNGPYLQSALENGFLKAPSNGKMRFYVMWANHKVIYNYWNYHKWGDNTDLLFDPCIGWDEFRQIVDIWINRYFKLPNYFKIDGKPVLGVFAVQNFVDGFGSEEEAAKAMEWFRSEVKKAGFPDVYLMGMSGGGFHLNEANKARIENHKKILNTDGYSLYNMGGMKDQDYLHYAAESVKIREELDAYLKEPFYPCVSVGWDATPRYPAQTEKDVIYQNREPRVFGSYLKLAKDYADAHADTQVKLITINAWNEWIEDSYLLPDKKFGYAYLEAVRDVFEGKYE